MTWIFDYFELYLDDILVYYLIYDLIFFVSVSYDTRYDTIRDTELGSSDTRYVSRFDYLGG